MAGNSGPGYRQHPEHPVTLEREGKRVKVTFAGDTIADSNDVITLHEANYPPVYYLPRRDVKMNLLTPTAHHTHCPFKGDASYFTIAGAGAGENAVWSYEQPYDEVLDIKDRLAFYPNKVDAITAV